MQIANWKSYIIKFFKKVNIAMDETVVFDLAIQKAAEMVNLEETLIVVTADHGHTMTMGGYQTRGVDIRGT